eukprot:15360204-Ditylum_brightwellii.AAC.1
MERSKQNQLVVCNEDDVVDNCVDNVDNDSVDNVDDDIDDDGDYGADKHLPHLSQAAYYCLMERSKQNKDVVCNKNNDVDNGVDNSVDNGDDCDDDCHDGADKHLVHLSQASDCCLTERSKQSMDIVCNKEADVNDTIDNVDRDSVDNGDDDCVDDSDYGADRHLQNLS